MKALRLCWLASLFAASTCGCVCRYGMERTHTKTERGNTERIIAQPGTVLRIVCDFPESVGRVERVYPGRIHWAGGSESFAFALSATTVDIPLESNVTTEKPVRIYFVVDEDPPCPTRFVRSEWFFRGRPGRDVNSPHANTLRVRLSRFRDAREFAKIRAPASN